MGSANRRRVRPLQRVRRLGIELDDWPTVTRLTAEHRRRAFGAAGLSHITVIEDQPGPPNGPAILLMARRP